MNNYFKLTKILLSETNMMSKEGDEEKKKRTPFERILGSIIVVFVFIPLSIMTCGMMYVLTRALMEQNAVVHGVNLLLVLTTLLCLFFGMSVILNTFYFAKDVEFLLPMPIRSRDIVFAKFLVCLRNENIMQTLILVSGLMGVAFAFKAPILSYPYAVIALATIPVMPLAYCGIFSILMIAFTKFLRNREVVNKTSSFLSVGLMLFIISGLSMLRTMDLAGFVSSVASGENLFIKTINIIFPSVKFLSKALAEGDTVSMLIYLLMNVLAIVLFLVVAELFYYKGVTALLMSKRKKQRYAVKQKSLYKKRNPIFTYFKKEIVILFRSPVFFSYCILINLIWPFVLYLLFSVSMDFNQMLNIFGKFTLMDDFSRVMIFCGVSAVGIFISCMNCITSSCFSRESYAFNFIKVMPLGYKIQMNIKAIAGFLLSSVMQIAVILFMGITSGLSAEYILLFLAINLMGVFFISYMGAYTDALSPKTIWDDELHVMRGNLNTFLAMVIAIIAVFALFGVGAILTLLCKLNFGLVAAILLIGMALADVYAYYMATVKGTKSVENFGNNFEQ